MDGEFLEAAIRPQASVQAATELSKLGVERPTQPKSVLDDQLDAERELTMAPIAVEVKGGKGLSVEEDAPRRMPVVDVASLDEDLAAGDQEGPRKGVGEGVFVGGWGAVDGVGARGDEVTLFEANWLVAGREEEPVDIESRFDGNAEEADCCGVVLRSGRRLDVGHGAC